MCRAGEAPEEGTPLAPGRRRGERFCAAASVCGTAGAAAYAGEPRPLLSSMLELKWGDPASAATARWSSLHPSPQQSVGLYLRSQMKKDREDRIQKPGSLHHHRHRHH